MGDCDWPWRLRTEQTPVHGLCRFKVEGGRGTHLKDFYNLWGSGGWPVARRELADSARPKFITPTGLIAREEN